MSSQQVAGPRRSLGLGDAIAIIVGTVIGAGIYETTPLIANETSGMWQLVWVFLLGGLCAVIGALCYTELGTTVNRTGGDFEYLAAAYGNHVAFVFAWMTFWVVQPASVGAIAYIFARYAAELHPGLGPPHFAQLSALAVTALTVANTFGMQVGAIAQKLLTTLKVAGILVLVAAGFSLAGPSPELAAAPTQEPNLGLALVLVMYTYGGWNVIVLVAAEVHDARHNLLRALLLSLAAIVSVYVCTVLSFEHALGHTMLANSGSAAARIASAAFGAPGAVFISVLICITCLANINATILTNSRIFFAFGRRWSAFAFLGRWDEQRNAPVNSLIAQGVIAIGLIFALAAGGESFKRLVVFSAPVFWLFFLLVSGALFILRRRQPGASGFRVPLYPVLPLAFTAICAWMLYSSLSYAWLTLAREAMAVGGLLVAGSIAAFLFHESK
jgi:amino acid transporter